MKKYFLVVLMILALPGMSFAEAAPSPHEKIELVTVDILAVIEEGQTYFEEDPDRFFNELTVIMDPLVDFQGFTRSVMGPYGTKDYYKSLKTKQEREQFKQDFARFVEVFREGLITTYGKGLLAFNGEEISVIPPDEAALALMAAGESVEVEQVIEGEDGSYQIFYKMKQLRSGDWMLRNMVINGRNVGEIYRSQFLSAMEKHENDFSAVVDGWVIDVGTVDSQEEPAAEAANDS